MMGHGSRGFGAAETKRSPNDTPYPLIRPQHWRPNGVLGTTVPARSLSNGSGAPTHMPCRIGQQDRPRSVTYHLNAFFSPPP
jgi:hypothetical protein